MSGHDATALFLATFLLGLLLGVGLMWEAMRNR